MSANAMTGEAGTASQDWMCNSCGFIYEEVNGWPDFDVPPGTRWSDVDEDFTCPDCGARKSDFAPVLV